MDRRIKLFGHPVHPMLIVFPLGLLSTAVIFDILYVATGNEDLAIFSFWALVAGLLGGVAAAAFGLLDWLAIPKGTRAKRIASLHGGGNAVVMILFAMSLAARASSAAYLPSITPLVLGLIGAGLALVTAWLGGELVFRMGVAVDSDADLNTSSSLAQEGPVELEA